MTRSFVRMIGLAALAQASSVLASGCLGPIVELDCAAGYEACAGRCVAVGTCDPAPSCTGDRCSDAGLGERDSGMGVDGDAGAGTSPWPNPANPMPYNPRPDVGGSWPELPGGGGTGGVLACVAPTVSCGNGCTDLRSDPDHCGGCGMRCASGICREGVCVEGYAGHVVLIGHDFRSVREGPSRILANAALLAPGAEIDVAILAGTARPGTVASAWRAIDAQARATARVVRRLDVDEGSIVDVLETVDVLLVPAQSGSSSEHLDVLGASWSGPLAAFTARGGIVIVLDGGDSTTWRLAVAAGLADVRTSQDVTSEELVVSAPSDALATGVPLRYRAERTSACFEGSTDSAVVSGTCGAVVLHRTIH